MKIVGIGEVLWDVIERQEYLGGAPFNFAAHLRRLGHTVFFVSGVGRDPRGERILEKMTELGLSTGYVACVENVATGVVEVTLETAGQPHFIIQRPAAYNFATLSESQRCRLSAQRPDWIYFGTLMQMSPQAKALTTALLASTATARRFYDVNLRAGCYEPSLVRELMAKATAVKLNEDEASEITRMFRRPPHSSLEDFCRSGAREFGWKAVCVTRGARGCALLIHRAGSHTEQISRGPIREEYIRSEYSRSEYSRSEYSEDEYIEADGYQVEVADTVGAGDAFAAAFLHGFGSGWHAPQIADFANRVGALVASRRGALPGWSVAEAMALERTTKP